MTNTTTVHKENGTVLLRGRRVPAEACTLTMSTGTGYTNIVRGTFTGRMVTCSPKIAATFLPTQPKAIMPNDLMVSMQMVNDREAMCRRLQQLIDRLHYRPDTYRFIVGITPGMKYPYIQLKHYRPDSNTGELAEGGSGKAYVSEWSSDSEVFQLCLALAIGYEQHEVREFFKVDGQRLYGPHIAWWALAEVCDTLDARQQQELNK